MTGKRLTGVRPFWLRANGCGKQVSYPVPGGGPPGSTSRRSSTWRVPLDGRIVAVGGHLHGSAKDMWLSQPRCRNRRLLDTAPRYGMPNHLYYRARPILHEPGPVDTRYFLSRTGIPVRRGRADPHHRHVRGLAPASARDVDHARLHRARPATSRSAARRSPPTAKELAKPGPVRTEPPQVVVPLNGVRPNGRTLHRQDAGRRCPPPQGRARRSRCAPAASRPGHISVALGAKVTWRFADAIPHNVLLASGPQLIGTPTLSHGATKSSYFRKPGRYELFCYLHPMTMHEVVDVRPPAPR